MEHAFPASPRPGTYQSRALVHQSRTYYHVLLAGTVVLAIGIRLLFWWSQARAGAVQPADSEEYFRGAVSLLRGGYDTGSKWVRPPLYPLLLAGSFAIFGVDVMRAMLAQAVLSGLGVLAFAALGRALFGRRDVALLSALLAGIFVPFAAFGSVLFAEALFMVLLAAFFARVIRLLQAPHAARARVSIFPRAALFAGVLLGLATLTRAIGFMFLPFVVLGGVLDSGRWQAASTPRWLRVALLRTLLVVAGVVLVIAPWTIRNALVYGRFVPVDTNGGVTFWYGTVFDDRELGRGEAVLARIPNLADKQRAAMAMAFADIGRDPLRYLTRVRYKVVSLWQLSSRNYATDGIVSFDPGGHSLGLTPGELPLGLTLIADAQYVLLVLGAIWGFCFAPRTARSGLLVLWVAFGTLISGLTVAHFRLRLPLLVVFVPYAAWALVMIRDRAWWAASRHHRWPLATAIAGSLIFAGLLYTRHFERSLHAQMYVWTHGGHDASVLHQAYRLNPTNPHWLLLAGDQETADGRWDRAEVTFGRAAAQLPNSIYAHVKLLQAALRRGDQSAAAERLAIIRKLGRDTNDLQLWAWSRLGIPPQASISPADPEALGNILGFAPGQEDSPERWTQENARLRLQPGVSCRRLNLRLRGHSPSQPVTLLVGGHQMIVLLHEQAADYQVSLPAEACQAGQPLIVELRSRAEIVDFDRWPWPVGVAVTRVAVE